MEKLFPLIVAGLVVGSTYGLAGMGLVLSYRLSKVVNFAHGAVALFCAYSYWQMNSQAGWGWPMPIALFFATVLIPAALALLSEQLVLGRVAGASLFARTSAGIGLLLIILGVSLGIWGEKTVSVPSIFPDKFFDLPNVTVSYHQAGVVFVSLALGGALFALLRFTRLGVELRAVVDRPELAQIRGISTRRVTRVAWIINFMLAAISGVLLAPVFGSQALSLVALVFASLVFAAVGAMSSLPITLAAGIVFGLADNLLLGYLPQGELSGNIRGFLPFGMLVFALIAQARRGGSSDADGPRTALLMDLGDLSRLRAEPGIIPTIAACALVLGFGAVFGELWVLSLATGLAYAVILLSFKSFTASTGLVSLGQGAFAGISAFVAAELVVDRGVPWMVAFVVAACAAAAAGAVVALPTVRLRGVFLTLGTIAFAQLVDSTFFASDGFTGGTFGRSFARPAGFRGDLAYLALLLVVFFALSRATDMLRRSVVGRELQADLAAGAGARSIGIRPDRGRLIAFAVSAGIAGMGGVLLSGVSQHVALGAAGLGSPWGLVNTLLWLTVVAIGGIGSIWGPLGAGLVLGVMPEVIQQFPAIRQSYAALFGLMSVIALRRPGGMVVRVQRIRAGVRKAFDADRRHRERRFLLNADGRVALPALRPLPARTSRLMAPDTALSPLKSRRKRATSDT